MTRRALTLLGLILFAAVPAATRALADGAASPAGVPAAAASAEAKRTDYLPDTTVMCRVGDRVTRVGDYVRLYFDSYAPDRPSMDSLGRVKFLDNIITKDVLGLMALKRNQPLDFEDRVQMRETRQRALSNALYRAAVMDSMDISDADIAKEYEAFRWEVHLRHILFDNPNTAWRVRNDLLRGAIPWKKAYERYSLLKGKEKPEGELGWTVRGGASLDLTRKIFTLGTGGISEPIEEAGGWNVVQVIERRPGTPPSLKAVRPFIHDQLLSERIAQRSARVRDLVRAQIHMVYDTTNVDWAASQFSPTRTSGEDEAGAPGITFNTILPDISPTDTSRVLARYKDGVYTLGRFMNNYTAIQPLLRPSINTPEQFRNQLDAFAFEPYMAEVAVSRGLDKDSLVVAQIAKKREQLMVERLYTDSVSVHISVDPQARREYYQSHLAGFITYDRIRFASLWAASKAEADSFATLLRNGQKAQDIIDAQKLIGIDRGSVKERSSNEHGEYQKLLFEEMTKGQVDVEGPDREGHYLILQKIDYMPGRQLSYDEAAGYIDDSLQNMDAERLLKEFVNRHRGEYAIESHPELVMRIRMVDPTL